MVCSTCGFENQPSMRFCGMCGTPLPHRPLTTPGAQSTLNYTRVPVESGSPDQETGSSSATRTAARTAVPGNGSETTVTAPYGPAETPTQHAIPVAEEAPPKELVPDISLDEYVQRFRYEPPTDATEVTMRGDASPNVEAHEAAATATGGKTLAEEESSSAETVQDPLDAEEIAFRNKVEAALHSKPSAIAPAESKPESKVTREPPRFAPEPKIAESASPAAESLSSRLGVEPGTPTQERVQRPRFLDINEPTKENRPVANSGTSSIVGPSFLGLSDAPLIAAEGVSAETVEDEPTRSHWRGWLAVAMVLIVAALGFAQWRAQASQSGNGPLQMIRAKIDNWRHGSAKPPSTEPNAAVAPSSPANTSPTTQSAPESPSQSSAATNLPPATTPSAATQGSPESNTPASTAQPSTAATNPANSSPAQVPPTVANSTPPPSPPAAKPSTNASSVPSPETPAAGSKTSGTSVDNSAVKSARRADTNASQPASGGATPGADEMAKAKDASDSAAAAAWLWKATAKGNPEAPVQLADMYIKGNGVPRSCEQAVVLLKTAAEKENALARNRLASMYATGNCVQRNRVEAYRWLSAALVANPNSQWAQQNRDLIWNQMTPDEQAAAQKYR